MMEEEVKRDVTCDSLLTAVSSQFKEEAKLLEASGILATHSQGPAWTRLWWTCSFFLLHQSADRVKLGGS